MVEVTGELRASLLDQLSVGIGFYALDGTILYLNRRALRYLGGSAGEWAGRAATEVLGEAWAETHRERTAQVLATEEVHQFTDRVELRGSARWLLSRYSLVKGRRNVMRLLIVFIEITSLKKAELELRASETRYRCLFEDNPQPIAIFDRDARFRMVNEALAHNLGAEPGACIGRPLCDFIPAIHSATPERINHTLRQGRILTYEDEAELPSGERRWYLITSQPLPGERVQMIAADISERKEAQLHLAHQLRFQSLVSQLSSRFVGSGGSRLSSAITAGLCDVAQYFRADAAWGTDLTGAPRSFYWLAVGLEPAAFGFAAEQPTCTGPHCEALLHMEEPRLAQSRPEIPGGWPEAGLAAAAGLEALMAVPVVEGQGSVVAVVCLGRRESGPWPEYGVEELRQLGDILAAAIRHQRAEADLHRYRRELRRLATRTAVVQDRERQRLATAVHDNLGQPLVALRLKLEAMAAETGRDGLDGPIALAEQLIEVCRTVTDDIHPPVLALGLRPGLEWLGEGLAREHGFDFAVEAGTDDGPLPTDLVAHLFRNARELLLNAAQHAAAQRVQVVIERESDSLVLTVSDDGVGFDPEEVLGGSVGDHIGLFSIAESMRTLGGEMTVEAAPGEGARLTLRTPLDDDTGERSC